MRRGRKRRRGTRQRERRRRRRRRRRRIRRVGRSIVARRFFSSFDGSSRRGRGSRRASGWNQLGGFRVSAVGGDHGRVGDRGGSRSEGRPRGSEKLPRSVFVSDVIGDERRGDAATRRLDRGRGTADSTATTSDPGSVLTRDRARRRVGVYRLDASSADARSASLLPGGRTRGGGGGDGRRRSRDRRATTLRRGDAPARAPKPRSSPSPAWDFRNGSVASR